MEALATLHAAAKRPAVAPGPGHDDEATAARGTKCARTDGATASSSATRAEVAARIAAADSIARCADAAAAADADADADALTEQSLKRLVLAFEKRVTENIKMRAKFSDQPQRFLSSEIELYAELKKLRAVAASPQLVPAFVATGCVPTLLGLLNHDNSDICFEVVELLAELTDADLFTDLPDLEAANVLMESLVSEGALPVLADLVRRLDDLARVEEADADADAAEAAHKALSIFENMMELDPPRIGEIVGERTGLLLWLVNRLKPKALDANKLYACELLAVLVQACEGNRRRIGELDGIDALLLAISAYKRHDPESSEEVELVENLFNSLCSALLLPANQTLLLRAEGLELLVRCLRENRYAARCAFKALTYALQRNTVCCERFVDVRGLSALFPYVGGAAALPRPSALGRAEREALEKDADEHLCTLLSTLCLELQGEYRKRLLAKFAEADCGRVARIVDIRQRYDDRVRLLEAGFAAAGGGGDDGGDVNEDAEDETASDRTLARLDAGLFIVQQATTVLAHLVLSGDQALSKRALVELHSRDVHFGDVVGSITEAVDAMGDDDSGTTVVTNNRTKMRALRADLTQLYDRMRRVPQDDVEEVK